MSANNHNSVNTSDLSNLFFDYTKRKIRQDFFIYILPQIMFGLVGFITIKVNTRFILPEEYGFYSVASTTAAMLDVFLVSWLTSSIFRFTVSYEKEKSAFFSTIFSSLAFLSMVLLVISIFFLKKYQESTDNPIFLFISIALMGVVGTSFFSTTQTVLRARGLSKHYSIISTFQYLLTVSLSIYFVAFLKIGAAGILYSTLFVGLSFGVLSFFILTKNIHIDIRRFSLNILKEFLKYGVPLIASAFAMWILSSSDRYFLYHFGNPGEVGLYSVACSISDKSIRLFTHTFLFAVQPILIMTWEKKGRLVTATILKYINFYFLLISLPAVVGISIVSMPLVRLLTSQRYWNGAYAMPFVAFGTFFFGLYGLIYTGLYLEKKTIVLARNIFFAAILNAVLNFIFVPLWGFKGAALTTAISYFVLCPIAYFQVKDTLLWQIDKKKLFKLIVSLTFMVIAVLLFNKFSSMNTLLTVLLAILIGTLTYSFALFIFFKLLKGKSGENNK